MTIVNALCTKNPCYTAGRTITVKGLMLHSVGCAQPSAEVFVKQFNNSNYTRACVHGFIDGNSGAVYQCLPWNHRGWHAGGSANNTHIGVEMCEAAQIKYTGGGTFTVTDLEAAQECAKRTYNTAVELFAMLCNMYNLNPLTAICSHAEGHKKGIASNHGDPEHYWTGLNTGFTMDGFRRDVAEKMGGQKPVQTVKPAQESYTLRQFVTDVQSVTGAAVDGIAGTETLSKTITVSATLNRKHHVVRPIQRRLNSLGFNCGTVDGIAGVKFTAAVKAFQNANGCVSDGEITARCKTWKKLLGMA